MEKSHPTHNIFATAGRIHSCHSLILTWHPLAKLIHIIHIEYRRIYGRQAYMSYISIMYICSTCSLTLILNVVLFEWDLLHLHVWCVTQYSDIALSIQQQGWGVICKTYPTLPDFDFQWKQNWPSFANATATLSTNASTIKPCPVLYMFISWSICFV